MFEVTGKYNTAKIFSDIADNESISQVIELCNQPYAAGSRIRMMPDIHAGAGCTIGTTMTIQDKISPNLVGVDIGCGMLTVRIEEKEVDYEKLDDVINRTIPAGFSVHDTPVSSAAKIHPYLKQLHANVNVDYALCSVQSMGGGNHFIELDKDAGGNLYLIIHTGSRHLGVEVAKYYQEAGFKALNTPDPNELSNLIHSLKEAGRQKEIESEVVKYKAAYKTKIPKSLAYVEGNLLDNYLHDVDIARKFAELNRSSIAGAILCAMDWHAADQFETIHNYIDTEQMILRKGSVSAREGERLLIPINMRDGCLICVGKGNPEWNYSAPHGAGRLMSRAKAKQILDLEEFRHEMAGVYSSSVCASTLDESPMAYKSMEDIMDHIEPTAMIERIIKPVYNFKAH